MQRAVCVLTAALSVLLPFAAGQEAAPASGAPIPESLPASPAKLFASLAKEARPQWRSYFRESVPRGNGDRFKAALALGAVCADCYLAAEARDGQQVLNLLTDIVALESALSISRQAGGMRLKFTELAEAGDWTGVRAEIAGLMSLHAESLNAQQDGMLAELERTGLWLRAWHIGARYCSRQSKLPEQPCIWSVALLTDVRDRTAKATDGHAAKSLDTLNTGLGELHTIWPGNAPSAARLAATLKLLDELMAELIGDGPVKLPAP
jgi:hypothetical protein